MDSQRKTQKLDKKKIKHILFKDIGKPIGYFVLILATILVSFGISTVFIKNPDKLFGWNIDFIVSTDEQSVHVRRLNMYRVQFSIVTDIFIVILKGFETVFVGIFFVSFGIFPHRQKTKVNDGQQWDQNNQSNK